MVKVVSFKERETDLIEFIKDKDFSYYIKDLIRKDMQGADPKIIKEEPKKKRNTNFEI